MPNDVTTEKLELAERERKLCQAIADALWQAATSENHEIAGYRSATYQGLQRAFVAAIREVYHLGPVRANKVRDLLAEYGPDDSLQGTTGRGIASYVQYVKDNPGRHF